MTPRRRWMLAGGALLALVLLVAGWNALFVRGARTVELPPKGEAGYNPLYALKIALLADGVRVQSRQRLDLERVPLGTRDTLVLYGDPRTLSGEEVDTLLDWIDDGGHLVLRTPPAEAGADDNAGDAEADAVGDLLGALAVMPTGGSRDCMMLRPVPGPPLLAPRATAPAVAPGKPPRPATRRGGRHEDHVDAFCNSARFTFDGVEPRLAWGDLKSGYGYARLDVGDGSVDVLADLALLTSEALDGATAATFARQVLAPNYRRGTVHLVYAASMPPLWRLLMERAWMAWLPLLLGFGAWLWMRTQRFGPLRPAPAPGRRALLEHVQASGEHLWRYGQGHLLHGAARDAFFARLRRRDPLAAALDGPARDAAIAARTGASAAEVATALQAPRHDDPREFVLRISRLLQLRRQL